MAKKKKKHPVGSWPDRLEKVCLARGLTQGQAAKRVRVSRRTWVAWKAGKYPPAPAHQLLIELLEQGKI